MRLTKLTGHAIRILVFCAGQKDVLVTASEIADRLGITQQNVLKLVHVLSHAGFVTAVRGRGGGVRLGRPAEQIRIGDVVRATEVTSVDVDGEGVRRDKRRATAPIAAVLDSALEAFISVLDGHTLADVVAGSGKQRPNVASTVPTAKASRSKARRSSRVGL